MIVSDTVGFLLEQNRFRMGGRQDFVEVMEFLYQRKLQIPIDTVAPLADGIKMIQRLESGQQFGKIVLKP